MRNRSKAAIAIAVLVAAVMVAASFSIYAADEGAGGFMIWNRDEAYFFVHVDRRGYSASFLTFPWIMVMEYFGDVTLPSESREFLVVIRVTPSGVERHVVRLADLDNGGGGTDPSKYTPLGVHIYADCPPLDGLCRWAGDHFERATQEERRTIMPERFGPTSRLTTEDFSNDPDGWSRRVFVAGPADRNLTIEVGDQFRLLVKNLGVKGTKNGKVSIDLLRPGKTPERIGDFETYVGRLSRAEYRHAFQDRE
jgi:hypothetical protein